ncbi:MAG TPA: radical SAM protein [Terriglobia bacterium]|nr:radical SAM protein [Terriglobia bacterium]
MRTIPIGRAARMIARGTWSFITDRPLVVSFEVTHSCTANCKHCDKGGIKPEPEGLLKADDYRRLRARLKPMAVQLSGGEPLLRKDLEEIVRAVKEPNGLPYTILVSNARLMTEEKYLRLRALGVNQFSISMDFPDERHDEFRRSPGLFAHLEKLVPALARHGYDDVVLNTAITRENLPTLRAGYEKAEQWGVSISYSAYTPLRTESMEHYISSPEDLALLRRTMQELVELKSKNGRITNSDWTLLGTYEFFKRGTVPGCNAGRRFLVVTPDGGLRPCSMFEPVYESVEDIQKRFVPANTCGGCYVSIRAYLDASFWTLLKDNVKQRVLARDGQANC